MSNAEALDKFMKNPRKYLLPPQPAPPCKVVVLGPPHSGCTTLSKKLAERYNAKVCRSFLMDPAQWGQIVPFFKNMNFKI